MTDDVESTPKNAEDEHNDQSSTPPAARQTSLDKDGTSRIAEDLAVDDPEAFKEPKNKQEYYERTRNQDEIGKQFFGELGENRPRADVRCLRKCLSEAFTDTNEVRVFCQDYFVEVYRNLLETDRFDEIIRKIIAHCESRGDLDFLWGWVATERPKIYERCKKYRVEYDQLEKVDWSHRNISTPTPDPASQTNGHTPPQVSQKQPHPLTTADTNAIRTWFFEDLSQKEQSFVTAVALFEGINRKHITALADEIELLLFTPEPEAPGNNNHE